MEKTGFGAVIPDGKLADYAASTAMLSKPEGFLSGAREGARLRTALRALDAAHDAVEHRYARGGSLPPACEWLLDNRYLARREGAAALSALCGERRLRRAGDAALLTEACRALVSSGGGAVNETRCALFLTGYQTAGALTQRELALFPAALRAALIETLARQCTALAEGAEPAAAEQAVAALFTSLRLLGAVDLAPVLDGVNAVELALHQDPAGVYPAMDEDSRALYRDKVTALAKKNGADERRTAEKVLSLAQAGQGEARHVGYWLFVRPLGAAGRERAGGNYIAANLLLTLFFTLLLGFAVRSVWAALLLLLPVSELVKSLLDFLLTRFLRPRRLPRMALEHGVVPEGRTLCVVSALLTGRDSGAKCADKLRRFHYLSRDCGENLLFGVLADLKESRTPETPADAEILAAAAAAVEGLNREFGGGFYLFTRARTYCGADKVYRGAERKRGAVMALAALLRGEGGLLRVAAGDAGALAGTAFLLTMDSDTELLPGTAKKLIGALLHPLNRPVTENGVVVRGHGVLQPRISVDLAGAGATDFSRVFAGPGGVDPYGGACGELYMDLFARGGFAGKGILDVDALLACCGGRFPENRVLSHDALEGAYLRGGFLGEAEVTDGFPGKPLSYFRRLHRWTRGDWQNLPWLFRRGRDLSDIDRFKLFDSLRRSLVAPATFGAVFAGFFLPSGGMAVAAAAALLALLSSFFLTLAERAFQKTSRARLRHRSVVIYGAGGALMRTFLRLWLLPCEAWVCFSAMAAALWRMAVSGKKLLQWETAAQTDADPNGLGAHLAGTWFAPVCGAVCLGFSASVIGRTAGLVWLCAPVTAWALSLPARKSTEPTEAQRRCLTGWAARLWTYFDRFCAEEEHFLPPDNVQQQPPVGAAHRTSPTNIGLALVSCLAALDLGIDARGTAMAHLEAMLRTVSQLKKWRGHLYNWYDTRTLRPLPPESVSTVDSGNLCACLITLKAGLSEYGRDDLAALAETLARQMDFAPLYDPARRLFHIGWDTKKDRPAGGVYDLMASEARLTSYVAVARGDVPERHWRRLSRAQLGLDGYRGLASWTGTMFEYLMPELFVPLVRDSLLYESARFCLYAQRRRVRPGLPWGVSESAFFALDPALNYRYKANGCAALALKRGQDAELVISPYSSFLALCAAPAAAVRNLRRLESRGMGCEYGFYEALDFTPGRCRGGEGERVKCVMSHHQGMSLIAAANTLTGGVMTRRFMADPEMGAYGCLLAERVPLGGDLLRRDGASAPEKLRRDAGEKWRIRGEGSDFDHPGCCLLSNGVYNIMSTEFGLTASACRDTLIYDTPDVPAQGGHGLELALTLGGGETSLLPVPGRTDEEVLWELSEDSVSVLCRRAEFSARCAVAAASGFSGEIRLVRLTARVPLDGFVTLRFRPVLASADDYRSHPAFWRLGLEAREHQGCLLLRRLARGDRPEMWLALACAAPAEFSADAGGGLGWLSYPLVTARVAVKLQPGESVNLRFSLCLGPTAEEAYHGAQRLTALGPADYADMPGACAALSGLSAREIGQAMALVRPLWFPRPERFGTRELLWRYAVSGDLPILLLRPGAPQDTDAPVREFCLLRCCGMLADLALITDDGGDYDRPVSRRAEDVLEKLGLGALLGGYGGVHLLPPSADEPLRRASAAVWGETAPPRRIGGTFLPGPALRRGGVPQVEWAEDHFSFYVNHYLPRRCWSDVLCSGDFGFLAADCGCGGLWYRNAREQPINGWPGDALEVAGPETLEIETAAGRFSLFAAEDGLPCRVRFGFGWARWEKDFGSFATAVTASLPPRRDARVLTVETVGPAEGRLLWKTDLRLAADGDDRGAVVVDYVNSIFSASSPRSYTEGLRFLAAFSAPPAAYTCDGGKWRRGELDGGTATGGEPVIGAALPLGGRLTLVCGCCGEDELLELCQPDTAAAAPLEAGRYWADLLGRFRLDVRDAALAHMMNGWAGYQAICCRLLGRAGLYQAGGAFGFRDQLQDAVNVLLLDPGYARNQILAACRHQYTEGDVMHWWHAHPAGDRGVRTRCSDDLVWLVWALCEYTEKTGDLALCGEEMAYAVSPPLAEEERDRYETPAPSDFTEPVLAHALRSMERCLARGSGPHGLLRFGSGDWNDGLDRIGGESVWLTWFFAHVAARFSRLLDKLCQPDSEKYASLAVTYGRAADAAWDGGWYLRGYWPDGERLGSRVSRCCQIDSIAQSWAALCEQAAPEKVSAALGNAVDRLFDRETGVVKLFDPPFADCARSPGYLESYGPGFRENGGQYTHGAIWLAMACLRRGREADGRAILSALLPENHDLSVYLAEPFVLPADVYTAPGHVGEAGWTWYTGSAGWYFRAVTEELLGLRLENGKLTVHPRLGDYTARWTDFEGRVHTITVKNGEAEAD